MINLKSRYDFWIVEGGFGTGKTIFLVFIATLLYKSYKKVYANFNLINIPNFVYIPEYSAEIISNLEPESLVLISEAYHYIDRRECMKPKNIETSQALQQIRKDKYFLICDVSNARMVDFRFINVSTMIIKANGDIENIFGLKNENLKFIYQFGQYNEIYDIIQYKNICLIDMKEASNNYKTEERIKKHKQTQYHKLTEDY